MPERVLPGERFKHVRSQGEYTIVCPALQEENEQPVVVYRSDATGQVWVRSMDMFVDGRFELLPEPEQKRQVRFKEQSIYLIVAQGGLICIAAGLASLIAVFIPGKLGQLWQALFRTVPIFFGLFLTGRALREYLRLERERQ